MKKLIYLLAIILFTACQQNTNKSVVKQSKTDKNTATAVKSTKNIEFINVNTKGILLGENIILLDEHMK